MSVSSAEPTFTVRFRCTMSRNAGFGELPLTLPLPCQIGSVVPREVPWRILPAPINLGLTEAPGFLDIAEERGLNRGRHRFQAGASGQAHRNCRDQ